MRKIRIDCFDRNVFVFHDIDELKARLINYYKVDIEDTIPSNPEITYGFAVSLVHSSKGSQHFIIFINDKKHRNVKPEIYVATVAHESYHTAVNILDSIGSDQCSETEEPTAYIMDYLTSKILKGKIQYAS